MTNISNKMFVTNNRSMEYNIDETYLKLNDYSPINRKILNITVPKEKYNAILQDIFGTDVEIIKKNEVLSFDEEENKMGPVFRQTIGFLKSDKSVVIDIAQDYYKTLQVFILYGNDENSIKALVERVESSFNISFEAEVPQNHLHIISIENRSLSLTKIPIKDVNQEGFIENNYNDDFTRFNEQIIDNLKTSHSGLILLHGPPGTGKTNYLRYLISQNFNGRKIIYIPPDMAHSISNPDFVAFMMQHKDSILLIEDAENILKSRESGGSQAVANLLNLSDGLLGDCLSCTVICTFNDEQETAVDKALLRKGRLLGQYKFAPLSKEKSYQLLCKVVENPDSIDPNSVKEMTLAEIYTSQNNDEFGFKKPVKRSIGFYT